MAKKKKESEVIVSFENSESVNGVTGSSVKIESPTRTILLECGLKQGGMGLKEAYLTNNRNFPFKVKDIDYTFVLHSHLDHIGLLPKLVKRGYNKQIIVPQGNIRITEKLLKNCAFILEGEAKYLAKKSKDSKEFAPIYTELDVDETMGLVREYPINQTIELDEDVRFTLINSGHITASCSLVLELRVDGNNWKKILYTSDLGNSIHKQYYVNPIQSIASCDMVISECTYSTKKQSSEKTDEREKDFQRIASAIEQSKVVLIPSFSFGRSQTLATMLYEMYYGKDIDFDIYMDSVLMNDMNEIYKQDFAEYRKVLDWDKIHLISRADREGLFKSDKKKVVIASSGMMQGNSASVSWLSHIIEKTYNTIVFCGYMAEGTLGRKIKEAKQKTLTISGTVRKNKCNIVGLKSMSGHIQHGELLDYLGKINCEKVLLHHGNKDGVLSFKKELEEVYSNKCKTTKVLVPNQKSKIKI